MFTLPGEITYKKEQTSRSRADAKTWLPPHAVENEMIPVDNYSKHLKSVQEYGHETSQSLTVHEDSSTKLSGDRLGPGGHERMTQNLSRKLVHWNTV